MCNIEKNVRLFKSKIYWKAPTSKCFQYIIEGDFKAMYEIPNNFLNYWKNKIRTARKQKYLDNTDFDKIDLFFVLPNLSRKNNRRQKMSWN